MALAIRFERLLREETIPDYAELARRGRVTRARMTQIMKLLHLAPDIQEQVLFLPLLQGLNERNLRPITSRIDWDEQRRMFQKITGRLAQDPGVGWIGSTAEAEAGASREIRVRGGSAGLAPTKGACRVMRKKVIPFPHFIARAQDLVEKIVR
jgi:hypothetical protein